MKKTILFALVLALGLATEVAKADFVYGEAINLGPTVNTSAGEVTPNISDDGLSLYFGSDRSGGHGSGDIWVSTRATKDDNWASAVNLGPTVNTSAFESWPTISSDELSLFFSDGMWGMSYPLRTGGYGNGDLWVTTRATKDDNWGTPVNLGPTVNSASVDQAPYISPDGLSLLFASDRAGGAGSIDLWVTTRPTVNDDWGPPVNLGPTVNSASSDEGTSISSDGLTLFFGSNRSGGENWDIWMTKRPSRSTPWEPPLNPASPGNSGGRGVHKRNGRAHE